MYRYPDLLARSSDTSFLFFAPTVPASSPSACYPDFPASAYFLTRNQPLKSVISPWKIWTNTMPRIQLPGTHSLPTHDIVGDGLQIESHNAAKVDTTIGAKTLC